MKVRALARRAALVLELLLYTPAVWACPVCFSAKNDENANAFVISTAFLSFLPLILFGGGVWWLRRRAFLHAQSMRPPQELRTRSRLPVAKPELAVSEVSSPMLGGFEGMPPAG